MENKHAGHQSAHDRGGGTLAWRANDDGEREGEARDDAITTEKEAAVEKRRPWRQIRGNRNNNSCS